MSADPALAKILGPLTFAARNDFKNLARIAGLERALTAAIDRALQATPKDSALAAQLAKLREHIVGFDEAKDPEKVRRAQAMLAMIDPSFVPAEPEKPAKATKPRGKRIAPQDAEPKTKLEDVAGVGPKTAEKLAARGLITVEDALGFLPRRYDDRREFTPIAELVEGEHASVRGVVLAGTIRFAGKRLFELAIKDESGTLNTRFFRFHPKAMEQRYPRGQAVIASGKVTRFGAQARMIHPELELVDPNEPAQPQGLVAIYPDVDGVPERTLRKLLRELARSAAPKLGDPLPEDMRRRLSLPALGDAILAAHCPDAPGDHEALRRRLVFDELFYLQLALALRRKRLSQSPGRSIRAQHTPAELAKAMFPFELTRAQHKAVEELARDLARSMPMARLLQGDVGCGKTAVALITAEIAIEAKRQVVLLAPTEILAAQHARNASHATKARTGLLTGSMKAKERRALLAAIASGEVELVIGTHALLEPDVVFKDLGLAIIDEQHRFGVEQRKTLREKNKEATPDLLVMTATPIPRTLAMAFYGDLALTVIDEMPPGRSPIDTKLFDAKRRGEAHAHLARALAEGRQGFIIYPLVEASEKIDLAAATDAVEELAEHFSEHRVGLLHGRMKAEEKAAVMDLFLRNEVALLVSTTVVEVGVDVPNATVMIVEHAERFGLSQLHQLRGRVGRGAHRGACFLIAGGGGAESMERLSILAASSDGFDVAEHDLKTRGPGELLGTRQHGLPDLALADLLRDADVLEIAREEALACTAEGTHIHASIRAELARRFSGRLDLLDAG